MQQYFEITDTFNKFNNILDKAKEFGAISIKRAGSFIEITSETTLTDFRLVNLLKSWRKENHYPSEFVKSKLEGRRDFLPL